MTLGKKIKALRIEKGMLQKELASKLNIGDGFLSKIESDQKTLNREYLRKLSKIFSYPFTDLNALWLSSKLYNIVKEEKQGLKALHFAQEQFLKDNHK